jgi:hypothetical protein
VDFDSAPTGRRIVQEAGLLEMEKSGWPRPYGAAPRLKEELPAINPCKAELVKLRCFTGMTFEEAAGEPFRRGAQDGKSITPPLHHFGSARQPIPKAGGCEAVEA